MTWDILHYDLKTVCISFSFHVLMITTLRLNLSSGSESDHCVSPLIKMSGIQQDQYMVLNIGLYKRIKGLDCRKA
jgi:hypothetical protein